MPLGWREASIGLHRLMDWFWRAVILWLVWEDGIFLAQTILHIALDTIGNPDGKLDKVLKLNGIVISREMQPQSRFQALVEGG